MYDWRFVIFVGVMLLHKYITTQRPTYKLHVMNIDQSFDITALSVI